MAYMAYQVSNGITSLSVEFKRAYAHIPELRSEPTFDVIVNGTKWFGIYDENGTQKSEILDKLQAIIDEYNI